MTLELDFKAEIKSEDCTIWQIEKYFDYPKGGDLLIDSSAEATVEFELNPEVRSWGIKSLYITIKRVEAIITWSVPAEDCSDNARKTLFALGGIEYRNGMIEGQIIIDTAINDDWKIESEVKFEEDGQLMISDVQIDFADKTITVS